MKLIIGLGNPGKKYKDTWHNVGFLALDQLLLSLNDGSSNFKTNRKFQAEIVEKNWVEEKIILAKPQTFMNKSGQAVSKILKFYKIKPADLFVIHDDIDLPLGKIRVSQNSSAAGHKGVQSIIDEIGTQKFVRLRIGIRSDKSRTFPQGIKPQINDLSYIPSSPKQASGYSGKVRKKLGPMPTEDYVLQRFNQEDKLMINEVIKKVISAVQLAITEGITEVMNQFN